MSGHEDCDPFPDIFETEAPEEESPMNMLHELATDTLRTGAVATAATTAAVSALGLGEEGEPIAPINAVSHIAWGDEAAAHDEASVEYTGTGAALNAAAVTGWAGIHELVMRQVESRTLANSMAVGTLVAAAAYVTDYYIVPRRFTPGFEKRLSGPALAGVYAVLAASLGVGTLLRSRRSVRG